MWKIVKLKDVCTIKTGRKDVNEGNDLGQYPFFTCAKEHTFSDGYSGIGSYIAQKHIFITYIKSLHTRAVVCNTR